MSHGLIRKRYVSLATEQQSAVVSDTVGGLCSQAEPGLLRVAPAGRSQHWIYASAARPPAENSGPAD